MRNSGSKGILPISRALGSALVTGDIKEGKCPDVRVYSGVWVREKDWLENMGEWEHGVEHMKLFVP